MPKNNEIEAQHHGWLRVPCKAQCVQVVDLPCLSGERR